MISENLNKAINDQINFEMESENIYLAMKAYCKSVNLDGFANFFDTQVKEEDTFSTLVTKLKKAKDNPAAIYMLDKELEQRVFTPPITE